MYQYTDFDRQFIRLRAEQFRDQLERWQAGKLTEEQFRPLRLQNGWYVQRYAPMLRVAVPYGELSSTQLRERVKRDFSIRFLVPPAVESYIKKKSLYKDIKGRESL